jgi:hypothetical protein
VERLERETDHSPPSSAEVKKAWKYTSISPIHHGVVLNYIMDTSMVWYLVKHGDKLTFFTFTIDFRCPGEVNGYFDSSN